jgi:hypothetical protein
LETNMRVVGIDPGLSATGLVLVDGTRAKPRVLAVRTYPTGPSERFEQLIERSRWLSRLCVQFCEDEHPDVVVVESFEDIAPLRGAKHRYYTPILIGVLDTYLTLAGFEPVYQSPRIKGPWKDYKRVWAGKMKQTIIPGDSALTNDHTRDACIHALAYMETL